MRRIIDKLLQFFRRPPARKKRVEPDELTGTMTRETGTFTRTAAKVRKRIPASLKRASLKNLHWKETLEKGTLLRWGLIVLSMYLLAEVVSRIAGAFLPPSYTPLPRKAPNIAMKPRPTQDYSALLRRNMFNVEGKIPEPFDQGLLDCMSQAQLSQQNMELLGTIVMDDERQSVALISDRGSPNRFAVKKDDLFGDGRFVAMKVERKRLCFQVKASQEFEYLEIAEQNLGIGGPDIVSSSSGIARKSETAFGVRRNFLNEKMANLNDVLRSAIAVPYMESGKFKGFLIQSVDDSSVFRELGIQPGDVVLAANDIVLDNAGKGVEAFNLLRNSDKISIQIYRGGQKMTLNYDVN